MQLRWIAVIFLLSSSLVQGQVPPEKRAPSPVRPTAFDVWVDGLGLVTGFLLGGADLAFTDRLAVGLMGVRASAEFDGVAAEGTGWGANADFFLTGRAMGSGWVVGGKILFLPTEFTDGTQSPELKGRIFGFGGIGSIGYQWVLGPVMIRPSASLAYLSFDDEVVLTGGVAPQTRDISKIHGTVPAAHLQIGVVF